LIDMAGSSARERRWTAALALGLLAVCALTQSGCLRPPVTPAESLGQQLYTIQPGTPVAAAPVAPGAIDPNALPLAQPAAPVMPGPTTVAPLATALPTAPPIAAPAPNPAADSGLLLSPGVVVAQVGSNVVMVASVFGPGRAILEGRRVEWMLAPGGVGEITAVGTAPSGFLGLGSSPAAKVNPLYAVGETFSRSIVVTHGAGTQLGDLTIARGQTWITVSSPNEGASYVTALAPELENWASRQQTAVIHWVDAQWSAAPPGVDPAGSRHTFTTTITRRTTGEPLAGWRVRYEITGGPTAGFAPDAGQAIEVPTNDLGQASAEIFQPKPEAGVSPILIQVIRPAGIVPGGQRLVVGTAATEQSWTGAALAIPSSPAIPIGPSSPTGPTNPTGPAPAPAARTALHLTGPAQASVGATASYRIEVTNAGDQPATGVIVADPLPDGLTYLRSTPPADNAAPGSGAGGQATGVAANLQWNLGTLQPGESRAIALDARVERAGAFNHCASVSTADGVTGQECVTTTARAAAIELRQTGPDKAAVGQQVRFEVEVVNRGDTPATGLVLTDRFDDGLINARQPSPISGALDPLQPGQSRKVGITLKVAKPGRLCNTFELTGPGVHETTQACLDASEAAPPPKPALSLKVTGPASARVGDVASFVIDVKNTGDAKIANVRVTNKFDASLLQAKDASQGYEQNGTELSWTIANLDPGQTAERRVNCTCLVAVARTCDVATVSDGRDLTLGDQACLEIVPVEPPLAAGGKLSLAVAARANPINVGGETSFVITLSNAGPNPERKVALSVTIPELMQYIEGATQNPTRANVDGQSIRFEPIVQLEPNKPVQFEIHAKANRAGDATLHAEAISQTTTQPVVGDATVKIVAQ
jgi:uncharacterized repeat protein (TIGR01451 family)